MLLGWCEQIQITGQQPGKGLVPGHQDSVGYYQLHSGVHGVFLMRHVCQPAILTVPQNCLAESARSRHAARVNAHATHWNDCCISWYHDGAEHIAAVWHGVQRVQEAVCHRVVWWRPSWYLKLSTGSIKTVCCAFDASC